MSTDPLATSMERVLGSARQHTRFHIENWLRANEMKAGGILVLRASFKGRDLVEADAQSETFPALGRIVAPPA